MSKQYPPGFRRLGIGDAAAMGELESQCFSMPWSAAQCAHALTQKSFAAYGLWQGQSLIAYVSFYRHPDELEILNLAVLPQARRQGHGHRMLGLLLQAAAKMGMQKAVLEVRQSNAAAISLYKKHGFRKVGQRRGYYTDTGENALVLMLDLQTLRTLPQ